MELSAGDIVAGHYRIVESIGRGGMGEVFSADNTRTGRRVALKLLRADVREKRGVIERFRREALATGRIESDHVTEVLTVEEDLAHGLVIVFELLEGESLIDRLRRGGPMPLGDLWPLFDQAWQGLIDAHAARIVHRDLKPSNVFLEKRPGGETRVKLLDFGIAKLPTELTQDELTLTTDGQNLGTYSYMAPEQIGRAKDVDERADVYAMGTMIFEALAAERPFDARNFPALLELKLRGEPRRLGEVMARVSPELEAFLVRCLAREPAGRFATATEARAAWVALRDAPAPALAPLPPVDLADRPPSSVDPTQRRADALGKGGTVKMRRMKTPAHLAAPPSDSSPLSTAATRLVRRPSKTAIMTPGPGQAPTAPAWPAPHAPGIDATVDGDPALTTAATARASKPEPPSRAVFFAACAVGFALLAALAFQLARAMMAGAAP